MNKITTIIRAMDVESKLFDQLSEYAQKASGKLRADPETERILATVAALDIIRQIIKDLESENQTDVETGLKWFKEIESGEAVQ